MPTISTRELEKFTRKFGKMLGSGIPLVKSLELIRSENGQSELSKILENVIKKVKEGFTFSSCLEMYPGVFTSVYVAMVKASEGQGKLDSGMVELADNMAEGVIEAGNGSSDFVESAATSEDQNLKVILYVNSLISEAFKEKVAGIFFKPESDKVSISIGDSSNLAFKEFISKDFYVKVLARIKMMSALDINERRLPQDGRILVKIDEETIDIRTQTLPIVFGEQMIMFFINKKNACTDPDKIFPETEDREIIERLVKNTRNGLVVFSGPTGSGKTTTLFSAASMLADGSKSIISVEDEVYYTYEGISQIKARPWIGLTMAAATRTAIRAEPHLVILSSLSDEETAQEAFKAAGNGVAVFTQMSARNPSDVFKQFLNLKVSSHLLYGGMGAVVFQVLVRKLCPDCQKKIEVSKEDLNKMKLQGLEAGTFVESTGCKTCNNTGYVGRIPLYEFIIPDKNLKDLIIRGNPREISDEVERIQNGYFEKKLNRLATSGITSLSEIKRIKEVLNPEL